MPRLLGSRLSMQFTHMKYTDFKEPKYGSNKEGVEVIGGGKEKDFTLDILSDKIHYYHAGVSAKEARSLLEKEVKEWEVKKHISDVDFWMNYLPELAMFLSRQPISKVKAWIKDK